MQEEAIFIENTKENVEAASKKYGRNQVLKFICENCKKESLKKVKYFKVSCHSNNEIRIRSHIFRERTAPQSAADFRDAQRYEAEDRGRPIVPRHRCADENVAAI